MKGRFRSGIPGNFTVLRPPKHERAWHFFHSSDGLISPRG
jgi:hypothetical protein